MPHAFLTMIAPGGAHDWEAIHLQPFCYLLAPTLGYWEDADATAPSQAAANAHFQRIVKSAGWPEGERLFQRDGVSINNLDFQQGEARMVVHAFMLPTPDGPLMHVMHCTAPKDNAAALEQARAILAGMRFYEAGSQMTVVEP